MSNLVTVRITIPHFEAPPEEWIELGDSILSAVVRLAEQTTVRDASAEVKLVDGSLKATAALVGGALMVYGVVADYKGFKESLAEIAKDSRWFATAVQEAIPKIVGQERNLARQDVKKGRVVVTAEEISKLIERLEKLKENSKTMSNSELLAEVDRIAASFKVLRRQLDQKDLAAVERFMMEHDLPVPRRHSPFRGEDRVVIRPDTTDELRQLIEAAERPKVAMSPQRKAVVSPWPQKRRTMYFKRAAVRTEELGPTLL